MYIMKLGYYPLIRTDTIGVGGKRHFEVLFYDLKKDEEPNDVKPITIFWQGVGTKLFGFFKCYNRLKVAGRQQRQQRQKNNKDHSCLAERTFNTTWSKRIERNVTRDVRYTRKHYIRWERRKETIVSAGQSIIKGGIQTNNPICVPVLTKNIKSSEWII